MKSELFLVTNVNKVMICLPKAVSFVSEIEIRGAWLPWKSLTNDKLKCGPSIFSGHYLSKVTLKCMKSMWDTFKTSSLPPVEQLRLIIKSSVTMIRGVVKWTFRVTNDKTECVFTNNFPTKRTDLSKNTILIFSDCCDRSILLCKHSSHTVVNIHVANFYARQAGIRQ